MSENNYCLKIMKDELLARPDGQAILKMDGDLVDSHALCTAILAPLREHVNNASWKKTRLVADQRFTK
jgi:hypothetical protein